MLRSMTFIVIFLNLSHPAFVSIIESMRHRPREVIYSQIASFDYLASSLLKRGGENLRNLLAVMDNDCADILFLLEDDLSGQFKEPKKTPGFRQAPAFAQWEALYSRSAVFFFRVNSSYHGFSRPFILSPETYYNRPTTKMDRSPDHRCIICDLHIPGETTVGLSENLSLSRDKYGTLYGRGAFCFSRTVVGQLYKERK